MLFMAYVENKVSMVDTLYEILNIRPKCPVFVLSIVEFRTFF